MMEQHQNPTQPKRCAIYTRKSSETGLEQSFNSLHAQREACEAYIKSQAHEGWKLRPTQYNDGGISGGTMERPALQQLIRDIQSDLVDVVVVYKVDRLSRSLADFARMVELFEQNGVSFVSVTQHFNTSSSMGRLTLNVLLSFAQFEREVTGERIRDKIAASKKKGMWMGGRVPLGYDVVDKQMVPNKAEAKTVQHIYQRYLALGCVRRLKGELDAEGFISKVQRNGDGGKSFSRGALYNLLRNPIYVGKVSHKGQVFPGQHQPILEQELWGQVQDQLEQNRSRAKRRSAAKAPSLLAGLLFDSNGHPMSPTHATKGQKRYRYYISQAVLKYVEGDGGRVLRIPATNVESVVLDQLRQLLRDSNKLFEAARSMGIADCHLDEIIKSAAELAERLGEIPARELNGILNQVLIRTVLTQDCIESKFNLDELIILTVQGDEKVLPKRHGDMKTHELGTPVALRRCGVENKLVVGSTQKTAPHSDSAKAIKKALMKAHRWNSALLSGNATTIVVLAKKEGCQPRYITDLIKICLLPPDVQEHIIKGNVPDTLTLDFLKKNVTLSWHEQRSDLNLNAE